MMFFFIISRIITFDNFRIPDLTTFPFLLTREHQVPGGGDQVLGGGGKVPGGGDQVPGGEEVHDRGEKVPGG